MDSSARVLLLPRPRRFGKTLNLSMLRYFLEKSPEDRRDLFAGLKIQSSPSAHLHFQKYPVIFLTLKDAKQDTWETCQEKLRDLLADLYRDHRYLLESEALDSLEKAGFLAILQKNSSWSDCENALYRLSKYLHLYHNQAPVILIDEYDSPLHAAFDKGYYSSSISFFRSFLSAALKDNPHLAKGVLTGILRVAKESIFSGLNNLAVFTILNPHFSTAFGFTEEEIHELLQKADLLPMFAGVQTWYNGYLFGETTIYNPWSILRYLDNPIYGLRPYWVATASNTLIKNALFHRSNHVQSQIEILLQGGCIEKRLDESIVMQDIPTSDVALWNFLLFSGYLKVKEQFQKGDDFFASLCIPNREVMTDFRSMTQRWFAELVRPSEDISIFFQSLLEGDVERVQSRLQDIVLKSLSYHDLAGEAAYHTFILGILANLSADYDVLSNREAGFGRYDVILRPKSQGYPGVLFEIKVFRKEPQEVEVVKTLEQALAQIHTRKYAHELSSRQVAPIHAYAIAFSGKQVWMRHQILG